MIRWKNVWHLYKRELRDQWRDRRTLFTVVVLPLMLYPILGMAMMQITQFMREKPTRVLVVGEEHLHGHRSLFVDQGFAPGYQQLAEAKLLELNFSEFSSDNVTVAAEQLCLNGEQQQPSTLRWQELLQKEMQASQADALLFVAPPSLVVQEEEHQTQPSSDQSVASDSASRVIGDALIDSNEPQLETFEDSTDQALASARPPQVRLFLNSSSDQSRVAGARMETVLKKWHQERLRERLQEVHVSEDILKPFHYESKDLARTEVVNAHIWAKILPFILFIWMLTGSYYCAVDLCAGEKERGTLETLLCSPAQRREIVVGKLLTTMTFSSLSGALNVICTVVTGVLLARQFANNGESNFLAAAIGTPPIASLVWLFLAMIPISALFGALSIAIAAFARSTKEGQHYLMPFLMVCVPLMIIPVVQGIEFDLGLSLIPVTGLMFLLRLLFEGQYGPAARFAVPVILVNGWCVHWAISWAVSQFNQESVLFRPTDRFSFWKWVGNRIQRREELPTIGQVILCTAVILSLRFFMQIASVPPTGWNAFAFQSVALLLVAVAFPAILFSYFFTSSPYRTLRLRFNSIASIGGAFLLAIFFHPMITGFQSLVVKIYPITAELQGVQHVMMQLFSDAPNMWAILLILAVLPAICEELAFRGFILSGLQRLERPGTTIVLSAILFGATHGFLQQSIVATFTGVILALLAMKTGSLIPCIVYHATHNAITLQLPMLRPETVEQSRLLEFIFAIEKDEMGNLVNIHYELLPSLIMIVFGWWILFGMENWQEEDEPSPLLGAHPKSSPELSQV